MPDVIAYRIFAWDEKARPGEIGGALFVNRSKQGTGRHDSPNAFGIYYCSTSEESAMAESIQEYRGQRIGPNELIRWGRHLAKVSIELDDLTLVDLDDPKKLLERSLRPSSVASPIRTDTQQIARDIFDNKAHGISWWSTLNSKWTNLSIFTQTNNIAARIVSGPTKLSLTDGALISAAKAIGVRI